jgi:cellulose synthase/poly-beta-1,6-N-acetylglucosamine synthase-like glycosyltransferase
VTVLVPAHNEEEQIAATIESLLAQTVPVQIVISADNCTDRTFEIADSYEGIIVYETTGNTGKKAGALNQAWARYGRDADFVFTMDADTVILPDCIQRLHEGIGDHGGVGVWPGIKPNTSEPVLHRWLYRMVRLEYGAVERLHRRREHVVELIAGMGALYRGEALRQSAAAQDGFPWNAKAITEDLRLSITMRRLGWTTAVIESAHAYTDAVADPRQLWRQRKRWAAGAWQELLLHGWIPETRRFWFNTVWILACLVFRVLLVALWADILGAIGVHDFRFELIASIPLFVGLLNGLSVWYNTTGRDKKDLLLSLGVLPMEIYSVLSQLAVLWTFVPALRRKELAW